jgi:hypothetical protein
LKDEANDEEPIDSKRRKKGWQEKCIKKIVYYETHSSTLPSPSSGEEPTSERHQQKMIKTNFNHIPFNYPQPQNVYSSLERVWKQSISKPWFSNTMVLRCHDIIVVFFTSLLAIHVWRQSISNHGI